MQYKDISQAILAVLDALDNEVCEVEHDGKKHRTVPKDLYLKVKNTLLQASGHFEDLADNEPS